VRCWHERGLKCGHTRWDRDIMGVRAERYQPNFMPIANIPATRVMSSVVRKRTTSAGRPSHHTGVREWGTGRGRSTTHAHTAG